MKIVSTKRFERSFRKAPKNVKKVAKDKFEILLSDISHPSLRVKKVKKYEGVFECRINKDYRLIFSITRKAFLFLDMGRHDDILS